MTIYAPTAVTAYADARAVLEEPRLVPEPAVVADAPGGSLAWLRATVARFTGDARVHARRRAHAMTALADLDPRELRQAAAGSAVGSDDRHTVVRVLAEALGMPGPDEVAEAVVAISAGYFGGELTPAQAKAADKAVASLLVWTAQAGGEADSEAAAQRIGVLVQACDATARLVENARRSAPDGPPPGGADALLAAVLRHDPPVTTLRRRAPADIRVGGLDLRAGQVALIDVVAAAPGTPADRSDPDSGEQDEQAHLAFGAGPHRCPGQAQALALAAGLLARDELAANVASALDYHAEAVGRFGASDDPEEQA
ncbi:cytochrome P450 [Catellatospora aurea]|uniref:Cytochrome P450 n=1 Tax=Catellatospora aurea TaxID=1337874 RepID=A0ABW2H113_9ACTN